MAGTLRVIVAGYSCAAVRSVVFQVGASEASIFLGRGVRLVPLGSVAISSKAVGLLVRRGSPAARFSGPGPGVRILDIAGLSTGDQILAIKKAVIEVVEGSRAQELASC